MSERGRTLTRPVHIVAAGVRCAVGLTPAHAAAAIRAGISRIGEHPFMTDSAREKVLCARDPILDPTLEGPERLARLADAALRQVDAALDRGSAPRPLAPLLLALPEQRPGFEAEDPALVRKALGATRFACIDTTSLPEGSTGHAGALAALQQAVERVSLGHNDVCVAGGVDSYLHAKTLRWLDADRRLARAGVRAGFAPGEGAALLAVASEAALQRYRLVSHARVVAVCCKHEPRAFDGDLGLLGEVLGEVIDRSTEALRSPDDEIEDVYGDINGERPRTEDWGFALMRTRRRFRDGTAYVTPVGYCGDVGAATGALGCVLAIEAWRRGYAHGSRALVWAGSWGGLRAAALLEQA